MPNNTVQDNEYKPGEVKRSYESKMQVKYLGIDTSVPKDKYPGSYRKSHIKEHIPADVWLVFDFPVGRAEISDKKIDTGWLEALLTKLDEKLPFVDIPIMRGCPRGLLRQYWPQNPPARPQVLLIGFTDRVGEEERNRRLRRERALSLKRYMEEVDPSLAGRIYPVDLFLGGPLGWLSERITGGLDEEERRKMNRSVAVYRLRNVITWTTQLRQANYVRNRENRPYIPKSDRSGVHRAGVVDDAIKKLEAKQEKGDTSEETADVLCMLKKMKGQKLHDRRNHDFYMTLDGVKRYLEDMEEFYKKKTGLMDPDHFAKIFLPEERVRFVRKKNEFKVAEGNSFRQELNWLICRAINLDGFLDDVADLRHDMNDALDKIHRMQNEWTDGIRKGSPEEMVLEWLYRRIVNGEWQGKRAASSVWNCWPSQLTWMQEWFRR